MDYKKLLDTVTGRTRKRIADEKVKKDAHHISCADHSEWDNFPLGKTAQGDTFFWNPVASPHIFAYDSYHKQNDFLFNIILHARHHPEKWDVHVNELRGFVPDYSPMASMQSRSSMILLRW